MAGGEIHLWDTFKTQVSSKDYLPGIDLRITGKLKAGKIRIEITGSKPSWEKTSRQVVDKTKIALAGKARAGKPRVRQAPSPARPAGRRRSSWRPKDRIPKARFPPRSLLARPRPGKVLGPARSRVRQGRAPGKALNPTSSRPDKLPPLA